ncbi:MAG: hypothetical protein HY831_03325 [Candidatus Aenigmarchaeota archaeon]|nr:hypothetical protein [Candidatus Aenigmarchaeota archaeon]
MVYGKVRTRRILILIAILLLILAIYLKFVYTKNCPDRNCFNVALTRCDRAIFTSYGIDSSWYYKIEGKKQDTCAVYVKSINVKSITEAQKLKDKSMTCYLPLGSTASPEGDIDACHGILKEELQDLIIQKMHLYIIQNIGKIEEEIEKPI